MQLEVPIAIQYGSANHPDLSHRYPAIMEKQFGPINVLQTWSIGEKRKVSCRGKLVTEGWGILATNGSEGKGLSN